jgi:hypothetical protein
MSPQDTLTLTLAALSTLILIRLFLPDILSVFGLITLKNGFTGGPEDANRYWPSKLDADLYQEMLALGFQPVGTFWEQLPFTRRFEEFVFARPGEKCFGLLYPHDQIMPRRGSFLTVFETGGVVFTKNYCGGVEVQEGDFLATGARPNPAAVFVLETGRVLARGESLVRDAGQRPGRLAEFQSKGHTPGAERPGCDQYADPIPSARGRALLRGAAAG